MTGGEGVPTVAQRCCRNTWNNIVAGVWDLGVARVRLPPKVIGVPEVHIEGC